MYQPIYKHALLLAWLPTAIALTGCDELLSNTQGVSILTAAPDLANAQGLDPNLEILLPLEQMGANVTAVAVGLAERDTGTALGGAQVSLSWDSNSLSLCEGETGSHTATSLPTAPCGDASLAYVPGTTYTTGIVTGADNFSLTVTAPNAIDSNNVDFSPSLSTGATTVIGVSYNLMSHTANTALTIDWSRDAVLTRSPTTSPCAFPPEPTDASPESTPARAASSGIPSSDPSPATMSTSSIAARVARSASSSWADTAPQTPITASPMNLSVVPPC